MPEAFKENFNQTIIEKMAKLFNANSPVFDQQKFIKLATSNLADLELKQRSQQITQALHTCMPSDFEDCVSIIRESLAPPSTDETIQFEDSPLGIAGWMLMPITDFITEKALQNKEQHFDCGLALLRDCTQRFSAEFSVRPFLDEHPHETLTVFHEWVTDSNVHVRRLVSEGCRPYLPWGMRLKKFAKQPELILPLLDQLKDDESEYVRRSVANNLNDIAKDHPDMIADLAATWWQHDKVNRQRLIKHACRTLIKDGHPVVLKLLGFGPATLKGVQCKVLHKQVSVGDTQVFVLEMENPKAHKQNLLIDFVVYHQKANGTLSPKVFKWKTLELAANSKLTLKKNHSFKVVSTRKYHEGLHKIAILINGKEYANDEFQLRLI